MKNRSWLLPLGTLTLGLVLGSLWSPRPKPPTPEQIAAATARHSSKSDNSLSRSSNSSANSSSRSQGSNRYNASFSEELSVENLIRVFSSIDDEDEINPMEFARYAHQISSLNEFEAKALLAELQIPFAEGQEDEEEMAEFAQFVSIVVFSRLCELNGPEAMQMLQDGKLGKDLLDEYSGIGMNAWVAADPEGASHWFNGALSQLDQLAAQGVDLEDTEDPTAALIIEGEVFDSYLRSMAKLDPEGLQNSIDSYQSEEVREEMQAVLAEAIVENASSKNEIMTLLNDDTFDQYAHGKVDLIHKLSESEPLEAARYVESQAPSATRDAMLLSVASSLLQDNPADGAAWYQAQELSSETTETERMQTITSQWMYKDLEGAATWLLEQPNNDSRDNSEALLAHRSAQTGEWEAAFRWSADISDPQAQTRTLDRVLSRSWNRRDNSFDPDAVAAARSAGFGKEVDNYIQSKAPTEGGGGRLDGRSGLSE